MGSSSTGPHPNLMSASCVFEMAAIVSYVVGREVCEGRYSVVGHSLGGAAVQYIVQDFHRNPYRNPSNRPILDTCSSVNFQGFAFNSIGLDPHSASLVPEGLLYSYHIEGEIVSWLGRQLGRQQAGATVRYIPNCSWPSVSALAFPPESIRRHRLPAVQQALCECLTGYGAIE